jgi:hypothetical protein
MLNVFNVRLHDAQRPGIGAVWEFIAVSDPMTICIKGTNNYLNRKEN